MFCVKEIHVMIERNTKFARKDGGTAKVATILYRFLINRPQVARRNFRVTNTGEDMSNMIKDTIPYHNDNVLFQYFGNGYVEM